VVVKRLQLTQLHWMWHFLDKALSHDEAC